MGSYHRSMVLIAAGADADEIIAGHARKSLEGGGVVIECAIP